MPGFTRHSTGVANGAMDHQISWFLSPSSRNPHPHHTTLLTLLRRATQPIVTLYFCHSSEKLSLSLSGSLLCLKLSPGNVDPMFNKLFKTIDTIVLVGGLSFYWNFRMKDKNSSSSPIPCISIHFAMNHIQVHEVVSIGVQSRLRHS